ncbi:MAG: choice-of-anchor L domain-containing protein, partial [Bacteroidia bacterium]|nr:choice-of-anchor L domain-containing protein [Bacteroidia bacterium]
PGIVGNQNIAVVPGSSSPVSINNVNSGIVGSAGTAGGCPANTNSNFYVDNAARTSINSYGGFTTLLTASSAVQACSIYHVKLVIADIQDGGLNSAIFLKLQGVTCNPLITINTSNDTSICPGFSANLSAIATPTGQTITWSPALGLNSTTGTNVIATPIVTTTYYATIAVAGCNGYVSNIKDSVIITVLPKPTAAAFITPVAPICLPAATFNFTTNVAGGVWTGVGITDTTLGTFDPAIAGIGSTIIKYDFTNTCGSTVDTLLVIIDDNTLPVVTAPYSMCTQGLPVTLTASMPAGVWSGTGITSATNGVFNPKIAGAGNHIINYKINKVCPVTGTANIIVKNAQVPILSNDTAICLNEDALLSLINPAAFKNIVWTNTSGILLNGAGPLLVSPIVNQKYYVTTIDTANCAALDSILVQVNALPQAMLAATEVCNTFATLFTNNSIGAVRGYLSYGDGGADSLYTTITHTYANIGSTFANFICINAKGCKDTTQLEVKVNPLPLVSFIADTTKGCADLCVNFINTSNASTYTWFSNGKKMSQLTNPSECFKLGDYSIQLIATSDKGCVDSLLRSNYIHAYYVPKASITSEPKTTTMLNPYVEIINKSDSLYNANYNWSFDDTTAYTNTLKSLNYTFKDTGSYTIKQVVTNKYGCKDSAYTTVIIGPMVSIYIPNAFTPNGDGTNDYFDIKSVGVVDYTIDVFDRWGARVSTIVYGDSLGWNGKYLKTNNDCKQDYYVWKLSYKTLQKNTYTKVGTVTLLK